MFTTGHVAAMLGVESRVLSDLTRRHWLPCGYLDPAHAPNGTGHHAVWTRTDVVVMEFLFNFVHGHGEHHAQLATHGDLVDGMVAAIRAAKYGTELVTAKTTRNRLHLAFQPDWNLAARWLAGMTD